MNVTETFKAYISDCQGLVYTDEPLNKYCTFRIGGKAQVLFIPKNEKALIAAVNFCRNYDVPLTVLGNGSNVLISDKGLQGITVRLAGGLTDLIYLGQNVIAAGAGIPLTRLCTFAQDRSLTGLEFAYGIPGSVGGAVYMNAGAYGGEIKNVLLSVRSVDLTDGSVTETPMSEMEFSYRNTPFMHNNRVITAAYFQLKPGSKTEITAKMDELMAKRKASQPLEYPSAGSAFKRPQTGYAAAMIDECGLKGYTVGGAKVSEKHAGFVINTGSATFDDVKQILKDIRKTVSDKCGVSLIPEIEIMGE